ncbi:endo-1,4-beta-xylanase [Clavibacter michiganensis]|uniref:endo-1,4-beta-xylanase n=1 Tax=Clavibacter michiganensis TaxID=28447 RepID=UPI0019590F17|nr:endo-1,4-beta-xylanase [Clavibacter michiganensis]MBM7410853.1 endo-1,4-beta-xylanase [Clavibacter michiganensis]
MSIPRTDTSALADVSPPRPSRSRLALRPRGDRRRGLAALTALGLIAGAGALTAPAAQAADAAAPAGIGSDFESGTGAWAPRGDGVRIAPSTEARTGSGSLLVTDRTQEWHGAALDVTSALAVGQQVEVTVWARLAAGEEPASLKVSVQRDTGGGSGYDGVAGAAARVTADAWTELTGTYTLGGPVDRAQVYVEGTVGADFLLDDFQLGDAVGTPVQTDIPALKDVLGARGIEHVGVAIDGRETVGAGADLVSSQFDAFTPENAGKPESVQPEEGRFTFTQLDQLLDYADRTGTKVYYHVLFWHSQTPAWFFLDGDRPLTDSPADQAILKARMEAQVEGIADHIAARYPDGDSPIWAMDVVNEVIDDGPNDNAHDMRDSRWYQVLGEGFVDEGFRLARAHFPGVKLFINDYNTELPTKRADYLELISALVARGVPIDGVGHQAHVDFARPVSWLRDSIRAVERIDTRLLQAITELDVNASNQNEGADVSGAPQDPYTPVYADDAQAGAEVGYYYRDLFQMIRQQAASIDSVTFWGVSNARSWLRTWPIARPWEQPLPFDDDLQAAPAYWGMVDPRQLPARPADLSAPRIADVDDITAVATKAAGVRVPYALPSAIDTRDGAVRVVCAPPRSGIFPVGTTTVTCTAEDRAGNVRTSDFDVIVTRAGS